MAADVAVASTLKDRLKAQEGELLLVVSRYYDFPGCSGRHEPRPEDYMLTADYYLGVIASPFLVEEDIPSAKFCVQVGKCWSWAKYSSDWKECAVIHPWRNSLEELDTPIYAPDEARNHSQRQAEAKGERDPDYGLEVIIGLADIEEYLRERTRVPRDSSSAWQMRSPEEWIAEDKDRRRRVLPPECLEGMLEVTGIAEQRRQEADELLVRQQDLLIQLFVFEIARHNLMDADEAGESRLNFSPSMRDALLEAIEIGAHKIEDFSIEGTVAIVGVEFNMRPRELLAAIAEREGVPFPED